MLLFTPLSAKDANRAVKGLDLRNGPYYFVDRPNVDEAAADADWIVIDVPEAEVSAFESAVAMGLGYREFVIPGDVVRRFRARRASLG
jgi:hypothetical protein